MNSFRNTIEPNGKFAPEKDRYHLCVAIACPFAHRPLIAREVKGLHDIISVTVVSPIMGEKGWPFASAEQPFPGTQSDRLKGAKHIPGIYCNVDPAYTTSFTAPVLWDKKLLTIVNNDSEDLIRIFNTGFNSLLPEEYARIDLYPEAKRREIDEVNEWVHDTVTMGVYRTGLAETQPAYDEASAKLFASLDRLEGMFSDGREFVMGAQLTEADVRLYTSLIRFDNVYHGLFKCTLRSIREGYPWLHLWLRRLYWKNKAFSDTTNFKHIKAHYYRSLPSINLSRVIPTGPEKDILPL